MNMIDWICLESKNIKSIINSNKRDFIMNYKFKDNDIIYYIFGEESLNQCLYTLNNESKSNNDNEYTFNDSKTEHENMGLNIFNLKCVGIGHDNIISYCNQVIMDNKSNSNNNINLTIFMQECINNIELLQKKKSRQERRNKLKQMEMNKYLNYETRYLNDNGNRRSIRNKNKKISYKDMENNESSSDIDINNNDNTNNNSDINMENNDII